MQRVWQRLSKQLANWFPRTSAYLRDTSTTPPASGVHQPKPAAKSRSKPIYKAIRVTESHVTEMRERVAQAVAAGVVCEPSPEQWAMIVTKKPVTRVFAGAGSGKSTTLALRVVFMLKHLKVPLKQLTVISFTNASCAELRERLLTLCTFWDYPLSELQATQLVRTFHAAMGAQICSVAPQSAWFEQAGSDTTELEQASHLSLKGSQQLLLKAAFAKACLNSEFKACIGDAEPHSPYRLTGMFKSQPLAELFFQEGSFAQCLGLDVARLNPHFMQHSADENFVKALAIFWPYFQAELKANHLLTFDQGFAVLTKQACDVQALRSMQHVLIDEFQDISPQIFKWLVHTQKRLSQEGFAASLMVIGDDWQSIYGWRGSSPELFIAFDQHLKRLGVPTKSERLSFATNYRCSDAIVAKAQLTLQDVALKQEKGCAALRKSLLPAEAVEVVAGFNSQSDLALVAAKIAGWIKHDPQVQVMVLSRRNNVLKALKPLLDPAWPVRLLSIHRAKGLEADRVIILDDCQRPLEHPVRDAMYAQSKLFSLTYQQAMQDEALRLGYVAITRAKQQVVWYTQKIQGATATLI